MGLWLCQRQHHRSWWLGAAKITLFINNMGAGATPLPAIRPNNTKKLYLVREQNEKKWGHSRAWRVLASATLSAVHKSWLSSHILRSWPQKKLDRLKVYILYMSMSESERNERNVFNGDNNITRIAHYTSASGCWGCQRPRYPTLGVVRWHIVS